MRYNTTPTEIIIEGALKGKDSDNPNAYDILPIDHVTDIKRVEAINGGQLNKYTLASNSEYVSDTFTETSLTTAILTNTFDIPSFNEDYFETEKSSFHEDLDEQLQLAREKIMANS